MCTASMIEQMQHFPWWSHICCVTGTHTHTHKSIKALEVRCLKIAQYCGRLPVTDVKAALWWALTCLFADGDKQDKVGQGTVTSSQRLISSAVWCLGLYWSAMWGSIMPWDQLRANQRGKDWEEKNTEIKRETERHAGREEKQSEDEILHASLVTAVFWRLVSSMLVSLSDFLTSSSQKKTCTDLWWVWMTLRWWLRPPLVEIPFRGHCNTTERALYDPRCVTV